MQGVWQRFFRRHPSSTRECRALRVRVSGLPYDDDMARMGFGFGLGVTAGRPPIQENPAEKVIAGPQEPVGAFRQDFDNRGWRCGSEDERHGLNRRSRLGSLTHDGALSVSACPLERPPDAEASWQYARPRGGFGMVGCMRR